MPWTFSREADPPQEEESPATRKPTERSLRPALPSPVTLSVAGRAVVVELVPDRPRMSVREPGFATLLIRNSGPPLELQFRSAGLASGAADGSVRASLREPGGRVLLRVIPAGDRQGGHRHVSTRSIEHEIAYRISLAHWEMPLAPGHFFLHIETYVEGRVDPNGQWSDAPISVEAPLEFVTGDQPLPDVDPWGIGVVPAAYANAPEAWPRLEEITDPRALPVLLELAASPHARPREHAFRALAHFDDPRAVAVLADGVAMTRSEIEGADRENNQVAIDAELRSLRGAAASALADNPNPSSLAVLLAHRADPDEAVRRSVVRRLGREPGPDAERELRSFARDRDDTVRAWASDWIERRRTSRTSP